MEDLLGMAGQGAGDGAPALLPFVLLDLLAGVLDQDFEVARVVARRGLVLAAGRRLATVGRRAFFPGALAAVVA
jgi:hypothetical protein